MRRLTCREPIEAALPLADPKPLAPRPGFRNNIFGVGRLRRPVAAI